MFVHGYQRVIHSHKVIWTVFFQVKGVKRQLQHVAWISPKLPLHKWVWAIRLVRETRWANDLISRTPGVLGKSRTCWIYRKQKVNLTHVLSDAWYINTLECASGIQSCSKTYWTLVPTISTTCQEHAGFSHKEIMTDIYYYCTTELTSQSNNNNNGLLKCLNHVLL